MKLNVCTSGWQWTWLCHVMKEEKPSYELHSVAVSIVLENVKYLEEMQWFQYKIIYISLPIIREIPQQSENKPLPERQGKENTQRQKDWNNKVSKRNTKALLNPNDNKNQKRILLFFKHWNLYLKLFNGSTFFLSFLHYSWARGTAWAYKTERNNIETTLETHTKCLRRL